MTTVGSSCARLMVWGSGRRTGGEGVTTVGSCTRCCAADDCRYIVTTTAIEQPSCFCQVLCLNLLRI